jgi:formylglycine-generating enzyme required for sulfatase activity
MDKYLVTVGRFRQYVNYVTGTGGASPANGSGIHTHLNGGLGLANSGSAGTYETGWDATDWNTYIATGAGAASTWDTNLSCEAPYDTWTSTAGSQETLPINCVDWYEAYAFCIWDGGFLPSEAEWEYVAAGGGQQREYPWGSTDPGTANQYAIYGDYYTANPTDIAPVGTATLGAGYWGQLDMAGEVWEWNLDWYGPYVDPCANCAYLATASNRVIRGGNFNNNAANLLAPNRNNDNPTDHNNNIGFRCAKTVVLPARQDAQGRAASTDSASAAIHSPPRSSVGSRVPRDPEQCPRRAPRVPRFPSRLYPFAGTRPGRDYSRTKASLASSASQSVRVCP